MAKVTGSAGLQDKHLSSERSRVKAPKHLDTHLIKQHRLGRRGETC